MTTSTDRGQGDVEDAINDAERRLELCRDTPTRGSRREAIDITRRLVRLRAQRNEGL